MYVKQCCIYKNVNGVYKRCLVSPCEIIRLPAMDPNLSQNAMASLPERGGQGMLCVVPSVYQEQFCGGRALTNG